MRQIILLFSFFIVVQDLCAQSAATAPSSASQSGYIYRLKKGYVIKYGETTTDVKPAARRGSLPATKIVNKILTTKDIVFCDMPVLELKAKSVEEGASEEDYKACKSYGFKTIDLPDKLDTICVTACNPAEPPFTVTSIHIDSISRYWYTDDQKGWRNRLRVSVTQADSGKLKLALYERDFEEDNSIVDPKKLKAVKMISGKNFEAIDYAKPISKNDSANGFYLQINVKNQAGQPISYISLDYAVTQYGAMTIPFKYRPAPSNIQVHTMSPGGTFTIAPAPSESTASINVAAYAGRKWGSTRFYVDPSRTNNTVSYMLAGFVGPSLVALNAANVPATDSAIVKPANIIAFSLGACAVIEWHSIDFGIFSGYDLPFTGHTGWIYANRPWIGFGIGVNLGMFTSNNSITQAYDK